MRPARIWVDTHALTHNCQLARKKAPGAKLIAMVKANAYGNGLEVVAQTLAHLVDAFGVACLEEAQALRRLGLSNEIVLFEGCFNAQELLVCEQYQLQTVVQSWEQLEQILKHAFVYPVTVWIKINTGMNRLGFKPEEFKRVYRLLTQSSVVGTVRVMTHFACADKRDDAFTRKQMQTLLSLAEPLNVSVSMANSAAVLAWPESHCDFIRPGIMLYGASPFSDIKAGELSLKPVMHFHSEIIALQAIEAGEGVGYGATWHADKPSLIGVVAAGYGDGYPRVISADARVYVNGYLAPIVGRVSMDMLTVDLTDVPKPVIGSVVELWGKFVSIDEVAGWANTLAYEIMCQVTARSRFPR